MNDNENERKAIVKLTVTIGGGALKMLVNNLATVKLHMDKNVIMGCS